MPRRVRIRRNTWERSRRPRNWSPYLFCEQSPVAQHAPRHDRPVDVPPLGVAWEEYEDEQRLNMLRSKSW
jgi:hypothetical protein